MSEDGEYMRGYQQCRSDMQIELDWWKKHAEAMESRLSLATRGFKVEQPANAGQAAGMKDMPK